MATDTIELLPPAKTAGLVEDRPPRPPSYIIPVGLVALFAAVLRIHAVAMKSFWLDEGISVQIARLPWPQFLFVLRHREANMALYYLLLRLWLLMGSTEGTVRGLSVLFSVATIPVVYALGARLWGRNTGLLAAWFLAINAYHVRYAQEARGYAMVVFFCALASWLLVRNLQEPAAARWVVYSVAAALAVYSHFFGALIIVAHGVSLAFLPRNVLPWGGLKQSARWMACMLFPVAIVVATVGAGSMNWVPALTFAGVLQFFVAISGNGGKWLVSLEAIAVSAAIFAAVKQWRSQGRSLRGWANALALACFFVPVILVVGVSTVRPIFVARYLNPCLPALALLVAAGIFQLRPRIFAGVLVAAITALSLIGTASYYKSDFDLARDDWRTATSYVLDRSLPGDGVFFYANFGRLPFEYYRSQRQPASAWPEALVAANGSDWGYRASLFSYMADEMQYAGPGGDRVWLVLDLNTDAAGNPNPETAMLRAVYGKGRHVIDEKRISQITVVLLAREASSASSTPTRNRSEDSVRKLP
jgi:mannosyltransferase